MGLGTRGLTQPLCEAQWLWVTSQGTALGRLHLVWQEHWIPALWEQAPGAHPFPLHLGSSQEKGKAMPGAPLRHLFHPKTLLFYTREVCVWVLTWDLACVTRQQTPVRGVDLSQG